MHDTQDFWASLFLRYAAVIFLIASILSSIYMFSGNMGHVEEELQFAYSIAILISGIIVAGICILIASIAENLIIIRNRMFEND